MVFPTFNITRHKSTLVWLFYIVVLIYGLGHYQDYGISWDEPIQRELGNANWNYVLHNDDSLFHLINRYHGSFIEMVEAIPERWLEPRDEKTIYLWRHLVNFLIFWIGSIYLFLLAKEVFKDGRYALLAVLILYLTPRILAQSFYNSKDIPLLSFFIISNYYLVRFLKNPSLITAIVFAAVSAMLFNIRIVGILIPVFAVFFFVMNLLNGNLSRSSLKFLLTYLLLFVAFAIAFYPVVWSNPVARLTEAFAIMSHYPFDDPQFFLGELLDPGKLPWYYIPVWMGVTIPVVWQLFFLMGLISVAIYVLQKRSNLFSESWTWLVVLAWLFVPWAMVLFLHSTLYDEWRHLFFIYPAFILLAIAGFRWIIDLSMRMSNTFWRIGLRLSCIILLLVQVVQVFSFMIRNHPYEYVYFNFLAGKDPEQKFDLDYWGLSYRQGLEHLVQNVKEDSIHVCWQNSPGYFNLVWLPEVDKSRLVEVPFKECEYFITNFRFHPGAYTDSAWHTLRVDDYTILAIEKLHPKNN